MRITIDIDHQAAAAETSVSPAAATQGAADADGPVPAATDEASAAVVARRTGAVNAGAAPAGPGLPTAGSEQLSETASGTAWSGSAESAGAAPTERG